MIKPDDIVGWLLVVFAFFFTLVIMFGFAPVAKSWNNASDPVLDIYYET